MILEIKISPYAQSMGSPNTDPFYTMRITLKFRGRLYQKEVINPLPELYSMMDYLFESARKEMKTAILAYMQTGSPLENTVGAQGLDRRGYFETPEGG